MSRTRRALTSACCNEPIVSAIEERVVDRGQIRTTTRSDPTVNRPSITWVPPTIRTSAVPVNVMAVTTEKRDSCHVSLSLASSSRHQPLHLASSPPPLAKLLTALTDTRISCARSMRPDSRALTCSARSVIRRE